MNAVHALNLCKQEMRKHGLIDAGWKAKLSPARKRCGRCCYTTKTIELSVMFVQMNELKDVLDTINHEIAHALTPGHEHDSTWQAMAISLGARPEPYADENSVKPKKTTWWRGKCKICGWESGLRAGAPRRKRLCPLPNCGGTMIYKSYTDEEAKKFNKDAIRKGTAFKEAAQLAKETELEKARGMLNASKLLLEEADRKEQTANHYERWAAMSREEAANKRKQAAQKLAELKALFGQEIYDELVSRSDQA